VGESLLGRIVDGSGKPLDGKGALRTHDEMPLTGRTINPLARSPIREPLDVGVRAINALITVGRGPAHGACSRVPGWGKSVLLGDDDALYHGRRYRRRA